MNTTTSKRGGARPGAGAKPVENKRRAMTLNVSPETIEGAAILRGRGIRVNHLFDALVRDTLANIYAMDEDNFLH